MKKFYIVIIMVFQFSQLLPQNSFIKEYGDSNYNVGRFIYKANDGEIVICGQKRFDYDYTDGIKYGGDILLLKINDLGDTIWTKTYGKKGMYLDDVIGMQ